MVPPSESTDNFGERGGNPQEEEKKREKNTIRGINLNMPIFKLLREVCVGKG
jgi:hypothetical protein